MVDLEGILSLRLPLVDAQVQAVLSVHGPISTGQRALTGRGWIFFCRVALPYEQPQIVCLRHQMSAPFRNEQPGPMEPWWMSMYPRQSPTTFPQALSPYRSPRHVPTECRKARGRRISPQIRR